MSLLRTDWITSSTILVRIRSNMLIVGLLAGRTTATFTAWCVSIFVRHIGQLLLTWNHSSAHSECSRCMHGNRLFKKIIENRLNKFKLSASLFWVKLNINVYVPNIISLFVWFQANGTFLVTGQCWFFIFVQYGTIINCSLQIMWTFWHLLSVRRWWCLRSLSARIHFLAKEIFNCSKVLENDNLRLTTEDQLIDCSTVTVSFIYIYLAVAGRKWPPAPLLIRTTLIT